MNLIGGETSNNTSSSGIGLGGLLAVLFIGLKLAGIITWSWWWVFSPLWIPFCIIIVVFICAVAFKKFYDK